MKLGGYDYGQYEAVSIAFDPHQRFVQLGYAMVLMARQALMTEAVSYRNFHVGASLLAVDEIGKRMGIYSAGNKKYNPKVEKYCAENSVIQQAQDDAMTRAIGLVVVGTSDGDRIKGVTGRATPTLHPCDVCRTVFIDSPIVKSDMLVVTTGDTYDAHQVHSVDQLIGFYNGSDTKADHHHYEDPGFESWEERQALYGLMRNAALADIETSNSAVALMALQAVLLG